MVYLSLGGGIELLFLVPQLGGTPLCQLRGLLGWGDLVEIMFAFGAPCVYSRVMMVVSNGKKGYRKTEER